MATLLLHLLVASVAMVTGLRAKDVHAYTAPAAINHPWPTARGPLPSQFGSTEVVVPHNFSASLAWSWHHPGGRYHTLVAGGPVIDAAGSFYLATNDGIRKFSRDGQVLWHFPQPENQLNNQPALLDDKVFGSNEYGEAFALDTKTGSPVWLRKLADDAGADCGYPAAYDGVFVVGAERSDYNKNEHGEVQKVGGNMRIFGLDASTGAMLWDFKLEVPAWNFAPLFPGDGTFLFMDITGSMSRVDLHSGTLLWHAPSPGAKDSFSTGGATLAPNGAIYSCSNPGNDKGTEGTRGLLRALNVADGELMWERLLPHPCNSYPAIGPLAKGSDLSVAVTPGSLVLKSHLHGSIMVFDAATGTPQWRWNAQPYTGPNNLAKGDYEGYMERVQADSSHPLCMPAHWSSANIAGDGTVYASRSDGFVYAVRGPADLASTAATRLTRLGADFESTPGLDVQSWNADAASLQGAFAFAPGTMALATCDTLYVFKF